MLAAALESSDIWIIVAIFAILIVLALLSLAEMGLARITKPKAAALVDKGHKSGPALLKLVSNPEFWVNPVLLTINVLQTVQAYLTGIIGSRFGVAGAIALVTLNVVVFFVLAESIPKTYAVLYPERAALTMARPTLGLVRFAPL